MWVDYVAIISMNLTGLDGRLLEGRDAISLSFCALSVAGSVLFIVSKVSEF
jgi:hypothetical protein